MAKRIIIITSFIAVLAIGVFTIPSLVKEQKIVDTPYVPVAGEYQLEKYKPMLEEAIDRYEKEVPSNRVVREPLDPLNDITEPRYKKTDGGGFDNAEAEDSGEAVFMFTGDIMCRKEQQEAAAEKYGRPDFSDSFVYMKDIFADADLVAGNLETTISESTKYTLEENITGDLPNRNAPSTYLDAIRAAGFDVVTTCNNHCLDGGVRSVYETIFHLDQYGLMHTGTFLNAEDRASHPFVMADVNGIKVAILSYGDFFNRHDKNLTDEGRECLVNKYDTQKVEDDISAAKAAGAEFIVVYTHLGREFSHDVIKKQTKEAREAAEAGADFIVSLHPHVLQKNDSIKTSDGRIVPVSYCLGNFISSMEENDRRETAVLKLRLEKEDGKGGDDGSSDGGDGSSDGSDGSDGSSDGGSVKIASLTYIPCYTLPEYEGNVYTVVPLTPERVKGNKELKKELEHIKGYLGDQVPCEYKY